VIDEKIDEFAEVEFHAINSVNDLWDPLATLEW
jgi:hypothetical protein